MTSSVTTAPPNAFVVIGGDIKTADDLPRDYPTESWIAATPSCIYAGCMPDVEGETHFTMGPEREVGRGGLISLFDGVIETPSRNVTVWTIEWETLLQENVPATRTRVRIWGNRPRFPDEVVIGLG